MIWVNLKVCVAVFVFQPLLNVHTDAIAWFMQSLTVVMGKIFRLGREEDGGREGEREGEREGGLTGVAFLHIHLEWLRLGRHGGKVDKEEIKIYVSK